MVYREEGRLGKREKDRRREKNSEKQELKIKRERKGGGN